MNVDPIKRTEEFQRQMQKAADAFERAGRRMQRTGEALNERVQLPPDDLPH